MRGQRVTGHGFACPECGGKTATLDSRPTETGTRRRKKCVACGARFTTWETLEKYAKVELHETVLARAIRALEASVSKVVKDYLDAVE